MVWPSGVHTKIEDAWNKQIINSIGVPEVYVGGKDFFSTDNHFAARNALARYL